RALGTTAPDGSRMVPKRATSEDSPLKKNESGNIRIAILNSMASVPPLLFRTNQRLIPIDINAQLLQGSVRLRNGFGRMIPRVAGKKRCQQSIESLRG